MKTFLAFLLGVLMCSPTFGQTFTQPFASGAIWNTPVASLPGASFSSVGTAISAVVTNPTISPWPGAGWVSVYQAQTTDPSVPVLYNASAEINLLNSTWKSSGNSGTVEAAILASSSATWPSNWNIYSTTDVTGATHLAPTSYHLQQSYFWSPKANVPSAALPSPGADSHMAVFQPNGWVLETYATIILSTGQVVCLYASYTWPNTNGTGFQDGRRATMVPNYAGLIRNGEYTSGTIPHALALDLPPAAIKRAINFPALAVDDNNSYTGTVIPEGALLAIPSGTTNASLGITTTLGTIIANACRTYGAYLVDETGTAESIFDTSVDATDLPAYSGPEAADLQAIMNALQLVTFTAGTDTIPGTNLLQNGKLQNGSF